MSTSNADDRASRAERALQGLGEAPRAVVPERYELHEEVGRGGMAIVYRARDRQLDRECAVKVVRDDVRVADDALRRFRREVGVTASLQHANVVTVYDAGESYLVMELVEGQSLAEALAERRMPVRELVGLVEKIARGVHAAHLQGIVHRDLKPSNVLLPHDGEPKVADFGVAHLSGNITELTRSGAVIGTPRYMAPEQVQAKGRPVTPRTDVYALGSILYEGLTGHTPHPGDTPMEVFAKIVGEEPARPRDLLPSVPGDLQTIALKALEKDPARRYATASALADDLARWLHGQPILAQPPSWLARTARAVAKRRILVAATVTGVAAVVAVLLVMLPVLGRSERTLELWRRITQVLRDAELDGRGGAVDRAHERLDRGVQLCREFLGRDDVADAHYFLGRLLRARGDAEASVLALDEALRQKPDLREANLERGLAFVQQYAALTAGARAELAGQPAGSDRATPPDALEGLHPRLKELRLKAIEDLAKPLGDSFYLRQVDATFGASELARMRWEWGEARRGLEAVLAEEPLYVEAHLSLAKLGMDLLDWDFALKHADAAIDKHAGLGEAHLIRGQAYFEKSETAGFTRFGVLARANARRDLDRAVELLDDRVVALTARGVVYWRLGDLRRALEDLDAAVQFEHPLRAIALNHRGVLHVTRKELPAAIEDFVAATQLSPFYAVAWANSAKAKALNGDVDGAIADARRAVEVAPEGASYRAEIASFLDFLERQ
ncbi:MAG: protein kinase [Planctomycetota bacterium]